MAPDSLDLRHYQAMHYCKSGELGEGRAAAARACWPASPIVSPALACLAEVRARQGRREEAIALLERVVARTGAPTAELLRLGELRMEGGETAAAIAAFERARALDAAALRRRTSSSASSTSPPAGCRRRATASTAAVAASPGDAMALFKRAQVSVLLGRARPRRRACARARDGADETTRPLVEREALFRGLL